MVTKGQTSAVEAGALGARWAKSPRRPVLGVVMIVRDEVENLPELFSSIRSVADEVVVVDTGSKDGTRALCKRWGVKLLLDPWRNDFSRARNLSIRGARSDYLLWLDADDRLPEETQRALERLRDEVLPAAPPRAYAFEVHNTDTRGRVRDTVTQVRLFPRLPGVGFRNPVHEEVVTSLARAGVAREETEIVVLHTGYASPEELRGKRARNEALLRESIRRSGADVNQLVHLAQAVVADGRYAEAEELLGVAIQAEEKGDARAPLLAEMHALRAEYALDRGDGVAALYDAERAGALWPGWAVPQVFVALARLRREEWDAVLEAATLARGMEWHAGVFGFPLGKLRGEVERAAATALRQLGRGGEVLDRLRDALRFDPVSVEVRLSLGQALLDEGDYGVARGVLEPLGEEEEAVGRFADVCTAIGLARAMTGDREAAGSCLSPLLDLYAAELDGAENVSPVDLARVLLRAGHPTAARNMLVLFEKTL